MSKIKINQKIICSFLLSAVLGIGGAIGALGEGTLVAVVDLIATEGIFAIPAIIGLLSASEAAVVLGSAAAIA